MLSNVSLNYWHTILSQEFCALSRITFHARKGERIALVGASGSGKSSLLKLIMGLLQPSEGSVLIDDEPVKRPRQNTALILQDFGLLPWKKVLDNAALGLIIRGVPKKEAYMRAREMLAEVGLEDVCNSYPAELSGGMQQRLALARSLVLDIDLLLMDEPLSALDAMLRERLQRLILTSQQRFGYTQIVVTHSIEEAALLGERVLVMAKNPGRIVADIANPHQGDENYLTSSHYHEACQTIREALLASEEVGS